LLAYGLSFGEIETRDIPNQGIHRSAWNALVFGLGFGLVGGLVGGLSLGLVGGLSLGLASGLGGGLKAGGKACLDHLALRLLLVRSGLIPWNYVKFLDYAADRILLRKVGGGYTFIHRMLLEYFAARYDESSAEATPNAERSQVVPKGAL
jgi:predicted lipid-binding transport protein (Tim44 family)